MPINTSPPPATYEAIPDPDGRGAVLQVTYAHNLDGESLAMRLYYAHAKVSENGEKLPTEISVDTLMGHLGEQGASCAEGWHEYESEPTQQAWDEVWPWAQDQVRRLFPDLTWNVESDRRIALPWEPKA
ncbi:hypothetical protein WKI65_43265 [Streptomyces sp. MS1.AVA.3]|uniref:hypothetical protein n=1 Tax=Streptomyces decoyicus TaxID=249567 RepID=UPI0030C45440